MAFGHWLRLLGMVSFVVCAAAALPSAAWGQLTATPVAQTKNMTTGFKGTAPKSAKITIMVEKNALPGKGS